MSARSILRYLFVALATMQFCVAAQADDPPAAQEADTIINLPIARTWELFTTDSGWDSLDYRNAHIELRIGGALRWQSETGDKVSAEVLAFEPQRMLSFKHAAGWSVIYFQNMGDAMTGIRWVEQGPANESRTLQALTEAHRDLFDKLVRRYAPECDVCKKERAGAK